MQGKIELMMDEEDDTRSKGDELEIEVVKETPKDLQGVNINI